MRITYGINRHVLHSDLNYSNYFSQVWVDTINVVCVKSASRYFALVMLFLKSDTQNQCQRMNYLNINVTRLGYVILLLLLYCWNTYASTLMLLCQLFFFTPLTVVGVWPSSMKIRETHAWTVYAYVVTLCYSP